MHRSSGSDPDVQHGGERWIRTKWNSVQKYCDGLFVGTNPTDELITSGWLPVIWAQSDGSFHSPVPRRWAASAVSFCHSLPRRVS